MAKAPEKPKAGDRRGDEAYRIVLLGGTGAGKSSLGNTLLGKRVFTAKSGIRSVTKTCSMQWGYMETDNDLQEIMVWDTPGLCDTAHTDEENKKMIAQCLASISPGAHIVLLVASGKDRFSEKEYNIFQDIKELVGEELLKHTIPIFTGADKIGSNFKFKADIEANQHTRKMLDEITNDFILIDNKATIEKDKEKYCEQTTALLEYFKKVVPKKQHLSSPIQKKLNTLMEKAVKEKMTKPPGMAYKEAKQQVVAELMADSTQPPPYFQEMIDDVTREIDSQRDHRRRLFCVVL